MTFRFTLHKWRLTRDDVETARENYRFRRQTPPPETLKGMFDMIFDQWEALDKEAGTRSAERARVAEVLRSEAANGDYGDDSREGLYLAAQLVAALTDDGIS